MSAPKNSTAQATVRGEAGLVVLAIDGNLSGLELHMTPAQSAGLRALLLAHERLAAARSAPMPAGPMEADAATAAALDGTFP